MAFYNKSLLKVISIVQIAFSVIFFVLSMVDRLEVRFVYTSFLFMPCWIAGLALPAGIMGLILANSSRPSSALINAQSSMSLACAVVSTVAVYHYGWVINWVQAVAKLNRFEERDIAQLKLSDQENTAVAISSLVVMFSIIEIALAVASASSSDSCYQPPQENEPGNAYNQPDQLGAGQIPLQATYVGSCRAAAQPMVAIPVSSQNVNQ